MNDENPDASTGETPTGSRALDGGSTPAQTAPTATASKGSGNHAVYDTRYEKFVGGVSVGKKPSKADARKLVGHDDFDIREV
jgi:hypothetical protein